MGSVAIMIWSKSAMYHSYYDWAGVGGLKHSRVALNHERELGGMNRGIGGGRMSIQARTHTHRHTHIHRVSMSFTHTHQKQ